MLKNVFTVVVRNIRKQPLFSIINVLGLTLGISTFLYINQYVDFESSYDTFHQGSNSIYRVSTNRYANGELFHRNIGAMPPLLPILKEQFDEIEDLTLLYNDGDFVVSNPLAMTPTVFEEEKAYYADENFFDIFGFGVVSGNPKTALSGIRKAAVSRSTAKKYFGDEDPLGKILKTTGQIEVNYEITAVFNDPPKNSHFKPDMIFSFSTYLNVVRPEWGVSTNWVWNDFPIYMRIGETNATKLEQRINNVAQQTWGGQYRERNVNFEFVLQPIQSIHTNSDRFNEFEVNTNERTLSWLRIISILTLIIALINFINLSTARSIERAKEVGVRKVIGANRAQLFMQFLVESLVLNAIAMGAALFLIIFFGKTISSWLELGFTFQFDKKILTSIGIVIVGGLLSAIYPSIILSGFRPIMVLKGKFRNSKTGIQVRMGLVYLQFIITPLLIGGTLLIYKQTNHLMNREIGINVDQVLVVKGPKASTGNMEVKQDYFKSQMEQSSDIAAVSAMMLLPGENVQWESNFRIYQDSTDHQLMTINLVEYDFHEVFGLELVAGRVFDPNFSDSTGLIMNESAAKMWGYQPNEIIDKTFFWRYSPDYHHFDKRVIGVVKDYKQLAYSDEQLPMIFSLRRFTPASFAGDNIVLRFNSSGEYVSASLNTEIDRAQSLWQELYPEDPFTYFLLDKDFNNKFQSETRFSRILNVFAILSIFIASMGLFGLSSFSILQRTKEFGIRKVLGASASNISIMIIIEYLKLIAIAYIIAMPILYLGAENWLNNYEVRINLDVYFFVIPMLLSLLIGLVSIIQQTAKSSMQNPVKSMRYE